MFKTLLITVLALAVVAAAVFVGGRYWGEETADETAAWKTYRNEKYGFEFKYPSDHTAYGDIDVAREVLIPATPTSDYVAIAEREAHVFCCEPITLEFSAPFYHPEEFPNYERKNITFAGRDAVEILGPGTIDSFYKVIRVNSPPDSNNESFRITITQKSQSELLDKILSTFKFTSEEKTDETAGRTLFRNEYFGFEITMPPGWEARNVSRPGVAFEFVSPAYSTSNLRRIVFTAESVDPDLISGLKVVETINGVKWEVYVEQGIVDFLNYETQRSGRIYRFQASSAVDSPEYLQQLREIISTFRFIN